MCLFVCLYSLSTLGLTGLFVNNQSPSHVTASSPTGLHLHSSTSPLTKTSFSDGAPACNGSLNMVAKLAALTEALMLLILSKVDCSTKSSPMLTNIIESKRVLKLVVLLESPADVNYGQETT
jgi:hypothetical protein